MEPAVVSVVILAFALLIAAFYFGYKFLNTPDKKKKSKKESSKCGRLPVGGIAWNEENCTVDCDLGYVRDTNGTKCLCDTSLGFIAGKRGCECDSTRYLVRDDLNNCECDVKNGYVSKPGSPYVCTKS